MRAKTSSATAKQHQQQQEGKTSATLPLLFALSFPFFLSCIAASASSLPPSFLSIYLSLALVSFSWLHQRLRMHACEATSAARVVRATQTQPLYTRSLCFSLFLSHSFNTINLSVRYSAISLQSAHESRKGKSRCERVRRSCTFAATDARCAHARERMNGEKARFPLFVNCARQAKQKSKSLRARTAAAADLLQMQRDRRRVQRLPRLLDYSTTSRTSRIYKYRTREITLLG